MMRDEAERIAKHMSQTIPSTIATPVGIESWDIRFLDSWMVKVDEPRTPQGGRGIHVWIKSIREWIKFQQLWTRYIQQ
ncbi:hypothetical protein EPA93_19115 [Ktedonosporobacter rubrisoli]|uniref:Uncharacterized protein n=1 Tax=Ktedonosporobacter rubrisoli TaxID=2509675 RepID=A0A4P6JS05_KTERU|nr:hypothetical protein [Ktedonosporobacter rubrisoli]QBD77990.1 hypothetical protein EPA93_19115 [Ktedonosporobacter rubrisoli]